MVSLQGWIAESTTTLPLCLILVCLVWCLPLRDAAPDVVPVSLGPWQLRLPLLWLHYLGGLAVAVLTSLIISETNNANQIIRIRTRLMAVAWLLSILCLPPVHPLGAPLVCACLYAVSLHLLFSTWQTDAPLLPVFHCMLALGIASLFWAPMLIVAGILFLHILGAVRSFSWRCFWAGTVGVLLPYWWWAVWALWTDSFSWGANHLAEITQWSLPSLDQYIQWPRGLWYVWGLLVVSTAVGIIHFLLNSYSDKLRVRSLLHIYLIQTLFLQTLLLLWPASWRVVLPMLAVSATPFAAHFFALVRNRLAALFFCLLLLCTILIVLASLFQPQLLS